MNLQENIRRILREELSPRIRRRLSNDEMENEFLESFEGAYRLTKNRKVLSSHFLDELLYTTITFMMDGVHWRFVSTLPEGEFWYDDIHQELENHYKDRIIQMYNEKQGINESILREEYTVRQMKLLTIASKVGLLKTAEMVGGIEYLMNMLGDEFLTTNNKIKIIKEVVETTNDEYITLMDMNENPIVLKDEDGELSQIEMIYREDVAVFHYGGYKYSQDLGESYMSYEELPKYVLDDIFNMVLDFYTGTLENK